MPAANTFLVGADPEFGMLDTNGALHGIDTLSVPFPQGKLGWDHGGRVVEIRPDPQHLASRICADIFRTLNRRELVPYRQFRWKAGGMAAGQPIGGHIHLDVPYTERDRYLPALDRMSQWFQTLELFPRGETETRMGVGFGRYGNVREHAGRLEYRTPPSWLYSPNLAHLALSAFKLAAVDPVHTLAVLHTPSIRPVGKFREFFEGFVEPDNDAAEIFPRLQSRGGLEQFRGDPNADLKVAWELPEINPAEPATSEFLT